VELLAVQDRTVGELCEEFEISQPAVSRHLRVLREAGLVASEADGQHRVYTLQPGPLEEIERWLDRYRVYWRDRLDDLQSVLLDGRKKKGKKR
jgi:DNA-binding transcriptional ArsR family regulator